MEKLFKNKKLVIISLDEDFFAIVNPDIKDGMKVINSQQKEVLDLINGENTPITIASTLAKPLEDVQSCCQILMEKDFVNFSGEFASVSNAVVPNSLNFWIHTTNECNLRCSYCNIHTLGLKNQLEEDTITVFFHKVVETVKNNGLKKVSLRLAGGEPLLKFDLWIKKLDDLRSLLSVEGCVLQVTFLTNLVALKESMIPILKDRKIGIGVSLDGLYDFQDSTRHFKNGKGSFSIVNSNLQLLIDAGIKPGIMTVVSNKNLDGLVELTKFLISKNLFFRYSFVQGEVLDIEKTKLVLMECYKEIEQAIISNGYSFVKNHTLCDLKLLKPFFQTCSNGFSGGSLYTNGDLYFCQTQFGVTEPIGSIFMEGDLLSILQRGSFYPKIQNSTCISCQFRYICTGGCPLERENGIDPHCVLYQEFIPVLFRLIALEKLQIIKQKVKGSEKWMF